MKAQFAILSVILTFAAVTLTSAQSSAIVGVYGDCNMACRYIKINSDFTFEELLVGDLYNGQRKKGTWKHESKTKIRAQSQMPDSSLQVRESVSVNKNFLITIVDLGGAVITHARVSGNVGGKEFSCISNDAGACEIPRTPSFDLEWNGFKGNYQVKNQEANRFEVELTSDQMSTVIDQIWMIEGDHLYVEYEGAFDTSYSLKRIPANRARKLFPSTNSK